MSGWKEVIALHILKYCEEKEVPPSKLIAKFKEHNLFPSEVLRFTFNGYDAFSRMADYFMARGANAKD